MSDVTLAGWLLEQIAADEAAARAATPGPWEDRNGNVHETGENANAAVAVGPYGGDVGEETAAHIARHDPARVLAECEAKRRIVEEHAAVTPPTGEGKVYCRICVAPGGFGSWSGFHSIPGVEFPCLTLRLLALPYADHDGYRKEWKP